MSAGNQQERLLGISISTPASKELGYYLAGFTDGEGSFNISFRRRNDYRLPWKVSISFNISQKDESLPKLFQAVLGCGTLRWRKDGVCYFEVTNLRDIINKVIPFFKEFRMRSKKQKDFEIFQQIAYLMEAGEHLKFSGIKRILKLRGPMNNGGKRKYTDEVILNAFNAQAESSEAIRQAPCCGARVKIWSTPYGDIGR